MSVEFVSTMSLEYCVSYVPERFTVPKVRDCHSFGIRTLEKQGQLPCFMVLSFRRNRVMTETSGRMAASPLHEVSYEITLLGSDRALSLAWQVRVPRLSLAVQTRARLPARQDPALALHRCFRVCLNRYSYSPLGLEVEKVVSL